MTLDYKVIIFQMIGKFKIYKINIFKISKFKFKQN